MPMLTINGTLIAYDDAGTGHPLLLVHAGIVDRRMWDPVWDALVARFRVIRPDLRGYGETPASTEPFTNWRDLAGLSPAEFMPAAPVSILSKDGTARHEASSLG